MVLEGSKNLATGKQTRFLVEMHSNPRMPMVRNAELVLGWCAKSGYAAWYLAEGARLTDPFQISRRGRCHLLLQPQEWPFPAWLEGIPQGADPEAFLTRMGEAG